MSVQLDGWFLIVSHPTVSGKTQQGSLLIPFQPTTDEPPVNCATRWIMSQAEAVEVLNATVNEVDAKYEKGCELLSTDLSNVVEIRSCWRGKETRGGRALHPVVVCFGVRLLRDRL